MKLAKQDLGKVAITVEKNYWNAIRAYDRLVIVEVMGVGCYISRKPVPAGIQYDNREYWIKLVNSSGGGGGSVNVVTEFGDSVELAIAQKTISDRFNDIDRAITLVQNIVNNIVNTQLPNVSGELTRLDEGLIAVNENLSMLQEDIADHLGKIQRIRNDLNNNVDTTNVIKGRVDEINSSLVALTNSVNSSNADAWLSYFRHKPTLYIGDRVTEQVDDTLMMSTLEHELGISSLGTVIKENNLNTARLRYILDNPDSFGDGLDLWFNEFIIVQLGSNSETIGTFDGVSHLDLDNPTDYPDTFCGNLSYFLDKVNKNAREEAIKPTIFIVLPPQQSAELRNAVTYMNRYINFVIIDPFNPRYDNDCIKNITVSGTSKSVFKYEYVETLASRVAREVKLNC